MAENILQVKDLTIKFNIGLNIKQFTAVSHLTFDLKKGNVLGIVGESGSGKTQVALSILGLNDKNAVLSGEILYDNTNLLTLREKKLNRYRWNHIAIIFQNAMSAFNPFLKIREQLIEPLVFHKGVSEKDAEKKALELLDIVKIPDAKNRIFLYPHEFSGGMLQRIMIAMALMCNPKILIADEITSGLDVTTQIQVLKLLHDLKNELNMSLLFITHDIGVLAQIANEVLVMYCGHVMEYASTEKLINNPVHPYTQGLLKSIPNIESRSDYLDFIEGETPNFETMPAGCPFSPRCPLAQKNVLTSNPTPRSTKKIIFPLVSTTKIFRP